MENKRKEELLKAADATIEGVVDLFKALGALVKDNVDDVKKGPVVTEIKEIAKEFINFGLDLFDPSLGEMEKPKEEEIVYIIQRKRRKEDKQALKEDKQVLIEYLSSLKFYDGKYFPNYIKNIKESLIFKNFNIACKTKELMQLVEKDFLESENELEALYTVYSIEREKQDV